MNDKLSVSALLPFLEEAFRNNKTFTLPITGTSMLPLLVQGRDFVTLSAPSFPLKAGDLPLYRRRDGTFVLHRIIRAENGIYTMCGDNQFQPEQGISEEQIIGIVTEITRDGRTFGVCEPRYEAYVQKMLRPLAFRYPARRARRCVSGIRRRLFRSSNSTAASAGSSAAQREAPTPSVSPDAAKAQQLLETGRILISVLQAALHGTAAALPEGTNFEELFAVAEMHKVTALAAVGLRASSGVPKPVLAKFEGQLFRIAARHTAQEAETQKICALFSEKGIRYCLLKGSRVSSFYEEPELRFMVDEDIYVEKGKDREAADLLLARGYEAGASDRKDSEFHKPPIFSFEIHRELKYDYDPDNAYYADAFRRLVPTGNGTQLEMTKEDFFVYILSHTAHHLLVSGTGIRSVIDDYYLRKNLLPLCDATLLREKLAASGLTAFDRTMEKLGDYWFGSAQANEQTEKTAQYILLSGIYGNTKNHIICGVLRRGTASRSKSGYLLTRLFPDRAYMQNRYPVLKKNPALLPLCWGARIAAMPFHNGRVVHEAEYLQTIHEDEIRGLSDFFKEIGL